MNDKLNVNGALLPLVSVYVLSKQSSIATVLLTQLLSDENYHMNVMVGP